MAKRFLRFYRKHQKSIKFLLMFLLFSVILALFFNYSGLFSFISKEWVDQQQLATEQSGIYHYLIVVSLAMAVGLPRQVAAFIGGYAFAFVFGTLLSTFAAFAGCCISYTVARFIARPLIMKKYSDKVSIIKNFLQHHTFEKAFIIRLIPAGNNFLLNLAAGVAKIKPLPFIGGSYLGYFPQMAIFALAGSGVQDMSIWQIVASIALSLIAVALSYRLYAKYQAELK